MGELVLFVIYTVWAVYSGSKFVNKRGWFAGAEKGFNQPYITKMTVATLIGYFIGGIYLVIVVLGLLGIIQHTW